MGRIERNAFRLNPQEFYLQKAIDEVKEIFEPVIKNKKIQFSVEISDHLRVAKVKCDKDRLKQVLINLISNALKFTKSSIRVNCFQRNSCPVDHDNQIRKERREENKYEYYCQKSTNQIDVWSSLPHTAMDQFRDISLNSVFISVLDDGEGISLPDQNKLFKLFGVLEASREQNKKGCGLGLTICKKIMTKMKGDIKVTSQVGVGTLFTIMFKSENFNSDYIEMEDVETLNEGVTSRRIPVQRHFHNTFTSLDFNNHSLRRYNF